MRERKGGGRRDGVHQGSPPDAIHVPRILSKNKRGALSPSAIGKGQMGKSQCGGIGSDSALHSHRDGKEKNEARCFEEKAGCGIGRGKCQLPGKLPRPHQLRL